MSTFWTEKQIEEALECKACEVTMPDGTKQLVRGFRMLWRNVELLGLTSAFSEAKLVELALMSRAETGRPFDQSFRNVVAYAMKITRGD